MPLIKYLKSQIKAIVNFWKPPNRDKIILLETFSKKKKNIKFIQIGANDGIDEVTPIRRMYKWKGVMIEPVKETFKKMILLNENDQGLFFENVAISEISGTKKIFKVGISNEKWATALTSFDEEVIKNHLRNGFIQGCAKNEGISMPENELWKRVG